VAAIEAHELEKTYPKGVRALDGLSFEVEEGEVFGLLGPNGAGKSTTVKILVTLSAADSGEARVAGYDVAREPDAVRRSIGYVPQNSGVDVHATGRENLLLQGRVQRVPQGELRRRVGELIEVFGIGDFADRIVRTYSGGMKRRLDVALGLVHRPKVFFLDEPTTGLDPEARAAMWEELERLAAHEKLTILLTTHYLEEADRLASRIGIVSRGRVVVEGAPDSLKRELRGDSVTLELGDGQGDRAAEIVAALGGIDEATVDGRLLRARVGRGAQAVPSILSALEGAGIAVASVTVARPTLDDVYLHVTGRDFKAEDEAGAEQPEKRERP
jgi:ABC-2 type transport system ATP-binding protein